MKVKESLSNAFKEHSKRLHTKFGTAQLNKHGYYIIVSRKEGNYNKRLNRLVFEDFYGINLEEEFPDGVHIHHIDGDKTNNNIWNLEPLTPTDHLKLHKTGNPLSEEHKMNIGKSRNTTGYFRVSKEKCDSCKQGFRWIYVYHINGKSKSIKSISLDTLKEKVLSKGLTWKDYSNEEVVV